MLVSDTKNLSEEEREKERQHHRECNKNLLRNKNERKLGI